MTAPQFLSCLPHLPLQNTHNRQVAWILPFFVFESLKAGVCVWLWHEKTCGARMAVDLALPHYAAVAPQIKVVTGYLDTAAGAISKQVKAVGLPSE